MAVCHSLDQPDFCSLVTSTSRTHCARGPFVAPPCTSDCELKKISVGDPAPAGEACTWHGLAQFIFPNRASNSQRRCSGRGSQKSASVLNLNFVSNHTRSMAWVQLADAMEITACTAREEHLNAYSMIMRHGANDRLFNTVQSRLFNTALTG